jgi:hypothetical protein
MSEIKPVSELRLMQSRRALSLEDKCILLQGENQKLQRRLDQVYELLRSLKEEKNYLKEQLDDYREQVIHYQAERDYYQERAQEERA